MYMIFTLLTLLMIILGLVAILFMLDEMVLNGHFAKKLRVKMGISR